MIKYGPSPLAVAGVTSIPMAGGFVTDAQQVLQSFVYSAEFGYTGDTTTGTLTIEVSNSFNPATHNPGYWTTLTGSSQAITAPGNGMMNCGNALPGYAYFRVRFTDDSSSANARMTILANLKGA